MIMRLSVEDVTGNWERIKYSLSQSIPREIPRTEEVFSSILKNILSGKLHVWIEYTMTQEVGKFRINAIATTTVIRDIISGKDSLLIYSLFGFNSDKRSWVEGLDYLKTFAKEAGCVAIVAYTNLKVVANIVTSYGGSADVTFLSIPVE